MILTRPTHYIEVDGVPRPELDLIAWARWFETAKRHVAKTYRGDGTVFISTVFLALDHSFSWIEGGEPILYETMIFWPGHELDETCERYAGREEAKAGHDSAVALVDAAIARSRNDRADIPQHRDEPRPWPRRPREQNHAADDGAGRRDHSPLD